jgi:hypothetical protein
MNFSNWRDWIFELILGVLFLLLVIYDKDPWQTSFVSGYFIGIVMQKICPGNKNKP